MTGDSFVVDASVVRSDVKTASYLTSYVGKGFADHVELQALGFGRRYAFSRNWPSVARMQLAATLDDEWVQIVKYQRRELRILDSEIVDLINRGGDSVGHVGVNITELVFGRHEVRDVKRAMKKVKYADI